MSAQERSNGSGCASSNEAWKQANNKQKKNPCIHGLQIFEKSKDIKGLGSSLTLASCLVVVFEQLGVYKELISIIKPFDALHLKKEDLAPIGAFRPPPNMNLER